MAINVKNLIVNALLELNQTIPLEKITTKQILAQSEVSKQTFYNHFIDKNDLIQYIYLHVIIPDYNEIDPDLNFRDSLLVSFENMQKYGKFMKEALLMEGQNNLRDYIYNHCKEFDLKWHQELYGKKKMPEALRFATEYHALASSSMTFSWILSDFPVSAKEMADMITDMRGIGMEKLFADGQFKGNPYQ